MYNLREIRTRISSLEKTAQMTHAMQMVSAVKLQRMQSTLRETGSMAERAYEMVQMIMRSPAPELRSSPWMSSPVGNRYLLIIISANRGLCGNINQSVFQSARRSIDKILQLPDSTIDLCLLGRKGADYFRHRIAEYENRVRIYHASSGESDSADILKGIMAKFRKGVYARINVIYTVYQSALQHHTGVVQFLPFVVPPDGEGVEMEFLFEPGPGPVMDKLTDMYLTARFQRVLLESAVAEHSARMCMMEQASKKAGELIDDFKLTFNKARQMHIDRELADIVSGVEASSG